MTFWMSMVWSIVYAVAEMLPASGDAFLNAVSSFFAFRPFDSEVNIVRAFLSLGLTVGCCAAFYAELRMFFYGLTHAGGKYPTPNAKISKRLFSLILVGLLPMLIGFFIRSRLAALNGKMIWLAIATALNGVLMMVAAKYNKGSKIDKTITAGDAFFVGFTQLFSVVPGVSRTGLAILAGLTSGFESDFALQFSVMMGIPLYSISTLRYFGAGLGGFVFSHILLYLVCLVTTAAAAFGTVKLMRLVLAKSALDATAFFCFGAGTVMLVLSFIN